ncbi:MAG: AmmeMemoRadiSam system protein A [Casimicrobiaceae bacterium]
MADRELGQALVVLARNAIGMQFGVAEARVIGHPALGHPGATFVTLMLEGELRGCVGSLEPRRALSVDVGANAIAAAFRDPRFPPLAARELSSTAVEVSLLSPQEALVFADEYDFVRQLRRGVDGIVLEHGLHRATFLPQVWETLPAPRQFVAALKRKAGLREDFWAPDVKVARYTVTKWKELEFAAEGARS